MNTSTGLPSRWLPSRWLPSRWLPSRWLYLVALLIPIIGIMASAIWFLVTILAMGAATYEFQAPALGEVTVTNGGRYAVSCDYQWSDYQPSTLPPAPALSISLSSVGTGERLLPVDVDVHMVREPSVYYGTTTHEFEIAQAGAYSLAIGLAGGGATPARHGLIVAMPEVLATFGPSSGTYLGVMLRAGGFALVALVAGMVLALITHVRRHHLLRRATVSVPATRVD